MKKEKKQKNLGLNLVKCHNCKETKELGINAFWCPRLINISDMGKYYGDFVCLNCCKKLFYENIHGYHLRCGCSGSCHKCDFPIGAILDIQNNWLENIPEEPYYISEYKDEDEKNPFYIVDLLRRNMGRNYPNFEWDRSVNKLKIVSKEYWHGSGIEELVLENKKLPTRIIITIDRTFNSTPFYWYNISKYYWSACGSEQYFDDEQWMDKAPVIIGYGLVNSDGDVVYDKEVKAILNQIKSKLKKNLKEK